jgi:GntR family transcriptional regulator / MocR family aminotransferase
MTLPGWVDLYAWRLDRASHTPLTRQIYMQVRGAVLFGALRPGSRMPSSRAMASKLGVARASLVLACEPLRAEGYIESRRGSGTFTKVRHSAIVWAKMVARRRFFDPRNIKRR